MTLLPAEEDMCNTRKCTISERLCFREVWRAVAPILALTSVCFSLLTVARSSQEEVFSRKSLTHRTRSTPLAGGCKFIFLLKRIKTSRESLWEVVSPIWIERGIVSSFWKETPELPHATRLDASSEETLLAMYIRAISLSTIAREGRSRT